MDPNTVFYAGLPTFDPHGIEVVVVFAVNMSNAHGVSSRLEKIRDFSRPQGFFISKPILGKVFRFQFEDRY